MAAVARQTGRAVIRTVAGIDNLGNTCFLNSVLQSLATLRPFMDYLEKSVQYTERRGGRARKGGEDGKNFSGLILDCLRDLEPVERPRMRSLRPLVLKTRLFEEVVQLNTHEQQDAEELLQILVGLISKEVSGAQQEGRRVQQGLVQLNTLLGKGPRPSLGVPNARVQSEAPPPNPLVGWLASTLQCAECRTRRPVRNSSFIDVSLHLSESRGKVPRQRRPAVLNGGSASVPTPLVTAAASGGPGGNPDAPYHLTQCLVDFASPEEVHDVECLNCALAGELGDVDGRIRSLKSTIETLKSIDDGADVSEYERVLRQHEQERASLLALDVDGDDRGPRGAPGGLTPLRRTAQKRLLFSRLPQVLCLHLGRRVFDPSVRSMVKLRQRVTFPLVLDMAGFAGYGSGRLSDDVAEKGSAAASAAAPAFSMGGQSAAPSLRSKYLLQSVIVHHGSADSGHYTAFRRVSHVDRETILGRMDGGGLLSEDINAWVHVSDDAVAPASVDEVLESEAYMLFYQALDSLGGAEDAADDDSQG